MQCACLLGCASIEWDSRSSSHGQAILELLPPVSAQILHNCSALIYAVGTQLRKLSHPLKLQVLAVIFNHIGICLQTSYPHYVHVQYASRASIWHKDCHRNDRRFLRRPVSPSIPSSASKDAASLKSGNQACIQI
jgi:hypothetical protein